jgi:hypothetical protein
MEIRGLEKLPSHMRDGVERYVLHGIQGGSFLTELFANRLVQAFGRADEENTAAMRDWASWLYNDAPRTCWGSPRAVSEWIANGGLMGRDPAA